MTHETPPPFSDTHPKIERLQIELLRQLPPWRKFQMAADMYTTVKTLALIGLRERHPEANEEELNECLREMFLGAELAAWVRGKIEAEKQNAQSESA
jgi:hypothetical protein